MLIDLSQLDFTFKSRPIVVGGKAMEYYGLRKAGDDVDLLVDGEDIVSLIKLYPDRVKDLWGDLGVCPDKFEIWRTINLFEYEYYRKEAVELEDFLIVSLEHLLIMKALAYKKEKYLNDLKLIADHIAKEQFKKYQIQNSINRRILKEIPNIKFIEKRG